LIGCYSPSVKEAQYLCPDQKCPPGQICSPCGICVSEKEAPRGGLACPGCALGARSTGDPGLPSLALCPAAWQVPGLAKDDSASKSTPCGRQASGDGFSAVDHATQCSVEDNCVAGWHVCTDENDVTTRGLQRSLCEGLDSQAGMFWATRQPASISNKDPTLAVCTSGSARIVGCGPLYSARSPQGCSVLERYIGELPAASPSPAWDCAGHSDGTWWCGTSGNEANEVTKVNSSHGGVLCCRDVI
jgi:hypothetical protein